LHVPGTRILRIALKDTVSKQFDLEFRCLPESIQK
jgi:hypothetical protein